jgi:hypothetical protein
MKLSKSQLQSVLAAQKEISRLANLQDLAYTDLCAELETEDKEGWLWDVLFNSSELDSLENL